MRVKSSSCDRHQHEAFFRITLFNRTCATRLKFRVRCIQLYPQNDILQKNIRIPRTDMENMTRSFVRIAWGAGEKEGD